MQGRFVGNEGKHCYKNLPKKINLNIEIFK